MLRVLSRFRAAKGSEATGLLQTNSWELSAGLRGPVRDRGSGNIVVVAADLGNLLKRNNRQRWLRPGAFADGAGYVHNRGQYSCHPYGFANMVLQRFGVPGQLIGGTRRISQSVVSRAPSRHPTTVALLEIGVLVLVPLSVSLPDCAADHTADSRSIELSRMILLMVIPPRMGGALEESGCTTRPGKLRPMFLAHPLPGQATPALRNFPPLRDYARSA